MDMNVVTGIQESPAEKRPVTHGFDMDNLTRKPARNQIEDEQIAIDVQGLNLYYGEKQALRDIRLKIPNKRVTAFIGPSGCGKSTLLRCFNRMNDLVDS